MAQHSAGHDSWDVQGQDIVPTSCSGAGHPVTHTPTQSLAVRHCPALGHHRTHPPPCRAHLALLLLLLALFLLVGIASGKEGPGHATDHGGHAGATGC